MPIDIFKSQLISSDFLTQRKVLRDLLTVLKIELTEELYQKMDIILNYEAKEFIYFDSSKLNMNNKISIWRGDITKIKIDAIVNAANSNMCGCFTPGHLCIDNVIHDKAGPRLRKDCMIIMKAQKKLEPTGQAKITPAYNLPSKYVLHTVGPIIREVDNLDPEGLSSCYIECLKLLKKSNLRSIAFCCISTGIFCYPNREAAAIALNTVKEWLNNEENFNAVDQIVFNVFLEKDLNIYNELLPTIFPSKSRF